jgi:hypothetical protein
MLLFLFNDIPNVHFGFNKITLQCIVYSSIYCSSIFNVFMKFCFNKKNSFNE